MCYYHNGRYYGYDDVPQTDEPTPEEEEELYDRAMLLAEDEYRERDIY